MSPAVPRAASSRSYAAAFRELHRLLRAAAVVVELPAQIDVTNAGAAGGLLASACGPGVSVVIADLSHTAFCDCQAIRPLIWAHQRALAASSELRLAAPSAAVQRLLTLTGAGELLQIFPTVPAALQTGG